MPGQAEGHSGQLLQWSGCSFFILNVFSCSALLFELHFINFCISSVIWKPFFFFAYVKDLYFYLTQRKDAGRGICPKPALQSGVGTGSAVGVPLDTVTVVLRGDA